MQTPKISIIIPVYNSEEYIPQCLDSLLSQTYENLEIICINDGSKDNSLKVLEHYKTVDDRITVLTQENKGQSVARNRGVEISTGDWITFVDSDDWVGVDCYNTFFNVLCNPSTPSFEIFMFNGTSFTKNESKQDDLNLKNFFYIEDWSKKSGEICTFKDCKNPFEGNLSVYNKIYRRNFIEKHNLKYVENFIFEDELYWIEAFCAAKSIYLCDEIFYFYRQQPKSTMHTLGKNIFNIFPMFNKIKHKLIEFNYYDMAKYAFLQHKFRQFAFFFFTIPEELREEFFNRAKDDLLQEKDFDINIIKKLKDFPLYFGFINYSANQFYTQFRSALR